MYATSVGETSPTVWPPCLVGLRLGIVRAGGNYYRLPPDVDVVASLFYIRCESIPYGPVRVHSTSAIALMCIAQAFCLPHALTPWRVCPQQATGPSCRRGVAPLGNMQPPCPLCQPFSLGGGGSQPPILVTGGAPPEASCNGAAAKTCRPSTVVAAICP